MKILLALDDNPRAVEQALLVARERGAILNALFVIDATWEMFIGHDWLSGCNARIGFLEYMLSQEEEAAVLALKTYKEQVSGIAGELLTVTGDVVEEIRKEAGKGYDLLVMSSPFTRGLEAMRDPVAKLAKNLPCDLLLVRPAAKREGSS
jgi:nucleotide-binding universal stress UspA family protein